MKLSIRVVAIMATILAVAGCDPEEQRKVPGVNAPLPFLYVLGDIYNEKHQPMHNVPVEVKGSIKNHDAEGSQPLLTSPGCQPAANNTIICTTPDVQIIDMSSVESFTFTYRFLTNLKGWQVGCQIAATRTGAGKIFDQERSDLTSVTNQEVLATCSFP